MVSSTYGSTTSTSYYYVSNIKTPVYATILETCGKKRVWDDVVKISWKGTDFALGDHVEFAENVGRIEAFTPTEALISVLQLDFPVSVQYSKLKRISNIKPDQLDPNEAFKRKKRTGRF